MIFYHIILCIKLYFLILYYMYHIIVLHFIIHCYILLQYINLLDIVNNSIYIYIYYIMCHIMCVSDEFSQCKKT